MVPHGLHQTQRSYHWMLAGRTTAGSSLGAPQRAQGKTDCPVQWPAKGASL